MYTGAQNVKSKRGLGSLFPIPRGAIAKWQAIFKKKYKNQIDKFSLEMQDARRPSDSDDVEYHQQLEALLKVFILVRSGYVEDLLSQDTSDDKIDELSLNLVLILMRLTHHFVTPDKPTAIGSKSKRNPEYKDPLLPLIEQLNKKSQQLIDLLEAEPWMGISQDRWIPMSSLLEFYRGDKHLRAGFAKIQKAITAGTHKSKLECEAYDMLSNQFDQKKAREIIDALIYDLEQIGLRPNLNAKGWPDRVRVRKKDSKKSIPK